jgi:hypothetical protein
MHPTVTQDTSVSADSHELNLGQQALWFLQQLAPDSSAYNVSMASNLHFAVDVAVMTSAVQRTVSRHRMLNCVFRSTGGEVRRYSGGAAPDPVLEVHELAMDDQAVQKFAQNLAQRPFRLDRELPIRVALLRRQGSPDILVMAAHHIVTDNVSQLLAFREILAEYSALSTGAERVAADTGADFDEFVSRQRTYLESPRAAAARTYWHGELAGVSESGDLPTDRPRPAVYRFAGSEIDFELPPDLAADVERAASARNTTVFAYLLSVFQLLLHKYSGQNEFVIGYPVTLRPGRRFRESIGYFVNTLPFHARVDPDESFGALLRRTGEKVWSGLMRRDYPFALMPRLVDVRREPSRAGLISTMFVMSSSDPDDPFFAALVPGRRGEHAGLTFSEFYLPQQHGQFDLTLQVRYLGIAARAQLKYNTSLFTAETARGLADDYLDLLRSAASGTMPPRLRDIGSGADETNCPTRLDEGA